MIFSTFYFCEFDCYSFENHIRFTPTRKKIWVKFIIELRKIKKWKLIIDNCIIKMIKYIYIYIWFNKIYFKWSHYKKSHQINEYLLTKNLNTCIPKRAQWVVLIFKTIKWGWMSFYGIFSSELGQFKLNLTLHSKLLNGFAAPLFGVRKRELNNFDSRHHLGGIKSD